MAFGSIAKSLSAFDAWLARNPVAGDRRYGGSSVQYHVARYCDYLDANPWPYGDPLTQASARDGAVKAYLAYLSTFGTPPATLPAIAASLDHFYGFLGVGFLGVGLLGVGTLGVVERLPAGLEAGVQRHAAVDVEGGARDVVGLVRGEPHGGPA
jgi:hypothetical protein